jgi:hypothetical protein
MLSHQHADRRQLGDLMATEPSPWLSLLGRELATAPATPRWIVIDDLVNLILGPEFATRTLVSGLPASLAPLALPAHQFLGLLARLRTPLRPRLRRI